MTQRGCYALANSPQSGYRTKRTRRYAISSARRSAQDDAIGAKQTVRSFLLRHDRRFGGKAAWTKMYWRWLSEQRFDFPHQQLAGSVANIGDGRAASPRLGIRQHWQNAD
jgi:hypothetical protein